jgi:multiple sugar transport system substrate-binding protein
MRAAWRACCVAALLLACSQPPAGQVLTVWAAGREGEVLAQLLADFEAKHAGLHVRVQQLPWLGFHEKLLTAVVGESTPDVAQFGNTWIAEFATLGALAPLDAEIAGSSSVLPSDYFAGSWATNRSGAEMYGIPWYVDVRLLFYRRDLLAQAGVQRAPDTWEEWLAALRAIQAASARPGRDGLPPALRTPLFLPLNEPEALLGLALDQPDPLLRDGGRFGNFRSSGFRHALGSYVSLFQSGLAPLESAAAIGNLWDEFARGSFVFFVGGPWQLGNLAERLPTALASSWETAPFPGEQGPSASLALGASLVVFKHSHQRPAAWQLIEYLSQPAVQRRFYELSGDLPPRRSSWERGKIDAEPHTSAFHEQLEHVVPAPAVPEWERIQSEVTQMQERAARGLVSVDAAGAELDARVDRILEKRRWLLDQGRGVPLESRLPSVSSRSVAPPEGAPRDVSP